MDNKIQLTIQSIFKGEGFTKATQATKNMSKDIKEAGGAVKDLAGSMGQLGGEVGKAAGGVGKLMGLMGAGPLSIIVAGVTAIVSAFVSWRNTMREVEQKMNDLARSRHEDMWARVHQNIAKAAKAQSDFFDEAIQKGQRVLSYIKQEQAARNSKTMAQAEKSVQVFAEKQAEADVLAAQEKRRNVEMLSREEATYRNSQIDLSNKKQHVDTEIRQENFLHKARMDVMAENKRMLDEERVKLEQESKSLHEKDEAARKSAQRQKKAYEDEVKLGLANDPEYQQLVKRQRRRQEDGSMDSWSANKRKRYLEDQEKVEKMEKDMQKKLEQGQEFIEKYNQERKQMMKRQQDINSRLTQIEIEKETAELRSKEELLKHNSKMLSLRQRYEDAWTQITNLQKENVAKQRINQMEEENKRLDIAARNEANQFQSSEFRELIMARSKIQQAQNKVSVLENTKDPSDKEGKRTLAQINQKEYDKAIQALSEAVQNFSFAIKKAEDKRDALAIGLFDIAGRHDQTNIQRGFDEQANLQAKIDSGGYTKKQNEDMKREIRSINSEIKKSQRELLRNAEMRSKVAKDGLEKQASLQDQLSLIRLIEDHNRATLDRIEGNTRERERNDLTGEGRARRRNEEKERRVENQKLENRIRQQENAAKRDAAKGWALDANGELVSTRGIASRALSRRQRERLQEYLQKKRLEQENKRLGKQEDNVEKQINTNIQNMVQKLNDVDNHLRQAISAQ